MKMNKIIQTIIVLMVIVLDLFLTPRDNPINLGDGYYFFNRQIFNSSGKEIPNNIVNYVFNKQYIIALQKPDKFPTEYEKDLNLNYENGRNEVYYWLIIKKESKLYGPILKEDFETLCSKLLIDVPEDFNIFRYKIIGE